MDHPVIISVHTMQLIAARPWWIEMAPKIALACLINSTAAVVATNIFWRINRRQG
ncbi:hypothetical protein [Paraburkholderia kururiensis]|uniref:hypothetical protein n=1 Tax=Paraburkholderia kururiensis TaxID=984307 RepID=UPI0013875A87|nr:hypothetical protein [Paraburkholderia kururiensis]